jgi:hypothetical protein
MLCPFCDNFEDLYARMKGNAVKCANEKDLGGVESLF